MEARFLEEGREWRLLGLSLVYDYLVLHGFVEVCRKCMKVIADKSE